MPIMLPPISDDDALELRIYLDFAVSQMGQPDSPTLCRLFHVLRERCQDIEDERWRNDPRNWGACCPWPDDDDFPF
ncbi:MAG: hypothetical protein CWE10_20695 [Symbiobacterium thermophilum]|uniref:Uncharacterized protein n=1 Tax=Symbiobacterium thermophilum TaxID=2734 RepID=A0A953IH50_SYMTR|nr:hypothetical protein [Symbiobacterium thermophilum]